MALPSEGSATVFEALNIHLEPSRQSPAFARIPDNGSVEVLAHRLEAKVTGPPKPPAFNFERPATEHRARKKPKLAPAFALPPKPPPPKPPANLEELSAAKVAIPKPVTPKPEESNKPVPMEDWTLVRTKDKQCGWVLSRNLIMSIPDEVAQYAEGKRITSYFALASINDEEKGLKHDWLWTTSSEVVPYDFDGWRVFIWNRRRHRYETSYREHDVEGYFPVQVEPAEPGADTRTFELITRGDDGKLYRRAFLFNGVRVHLSGKQPYTPAPSSAPVKSEPVRSEPVNTAAKPGVVAPGCLRN